MCAISIGTLLYLVAVDEHGAVVLAGPDELHTTVKEGGQHSA